MCIRDSVWIDYSKKVIHFKPASKPSNADHVYTFFLEADNPSLIRFAPKVDSSKPDNNAVGGTSSAGVDEEGNVVESSASNLDANRLGNARVVVDRITGELTKGVVIEDPLLLDPSASTEDAKDRADATYAKSEEKAVEATLEVIGNPHIRANQTVEIRNVGKRYGGKYLIEAVTHKLGDGYVCSIDLSKHGLEGDGIKSGAKEGTENLLDSEGRTRVIISRDEGKYLTPPSPEQSEASL